MKKFELAVVLGFVLTILISTQVNFAKNCDELRDEVFRIHILANSDSEADQNLKLKVRDRVLEETSVLFKKALSREEAENIAKKELSKIEAVAQDEIFKQGKNYKATAEVVNMYFSTRYYGNITMPAGRYDAVRIRIGEASGKNWWCVMFPPMCVSAACPEKQFTPNEMEIMTKPKYKAKFAVLEFAENIKERFSHEKTQQKVSHILTF